MNDLEELKSIQLILKQLDYESTLLKKSEDLPLEMLSVALDPDEKGRQQFLTIAIYPMDDELDDAKFIQFYLQSEFIVEKQNLQRVSMEIQSVNRQLPLGHFNLSADEDKLYFKYVLAVPRKLSITDLFLADIMDMCCFSNTAFMGRVEKIASS